MDPLPGNKSFNTLGVKFTRVWELLDAARGSRSVALVQHWSLSNGPSFETGIENRTCNAHDAQPSFGICPWWLGFDKEKQWKVLIDVLLSQKTADTSYDCEQSLTEFTKFNQV